VRGEFFEGLVGGEGVLRQIVTAQKEVQNLMREMEKDWGLD
jgi:hypothetical protein